MSSSSNAAQPARLKPPVPEARAARRLPSFGANRADLEPKCSFCFSSQELVGCVVVRAARSPMLPVARGEPLKTLATAHERVVSLEGGQARTPWAF